MRKYRLKKKNLKKQNKEKRLKAVREKGQGTHKDLPITKTTYMIEKF